MAYSYPLDLPNNNIARVTIRANTTVAVARSIFTGQTQVLEYSSKLWLAEVTLPIMKREDAEAWTTFLLKLNGPEGTFMMGDPTAKTPRGVASGTPLLSGDPIYGNSIDTVGWTPSTTNILMAGDYIQIGSELYKNLTDVSSDGAGAATLDIWPNIKKQYVDGDPIITSEAKGIWRLVQTDFPVFSAGPDKLYEVFFTAIEANEFSE